MIIKKVKNNTIQLIQGDITKVECDLIVNAANSSLMGGGGVDGAIHRAGGSSIIDECREIIRRIGSLDTGEAVLTNPGKLSVKGIIHTVGPIWAGGRRGEDELLKNCYINSLKILKKLHYRSIAFPNISTGVYGYPKESASTTAISSVLEFLENSMDLVVIFVAFDNENYTLYRKLLDRL